MSTPTAIAKESTGAAAGTVLTETPPAAAPANGAPAATPAPAAATPAPAAGQPPKLDASKPGEIVLALPEGSHLDAKAVERIVADAKARGLNQEQAQDLLKRENDAVAGYVKGQTDAYANEQTAWMAAIKADPEIGGQKFDESVTLAKRAVDAYGSDAFKKALNDTGLGNHPELVRVFARIGKTITQDDKILAPGRMPAAKRSPEQVFYPDVTPQPEA